MARGGGSQACDWACQHACPGDHLPPLGIAAPRAKHASPAGRTIDYDACEPQPGDAAPVPFSFMNMGSPAWGPPQRQVQCHATYTSPDTEAWVRGCMASGRGAVFASGATVAGGGCVEPRYCPSLETKYGRFPGRRHHVWLEPEGLDTHVVYPNGISNSMEVEDQRRMLRTIPGALAVVSGRLPAMPGAGLPATSPPSPCTQPQDP